MAALMLKKAAVAAMLAPVMALIFVFALAASLRLDDEAIARHIAEDIDLIVRERADNGRTVDSLTECSGLSLGLRRDAPAGEGPVREAIRAPVAIACPSLSALVSGEGDVATLDYFRYWHGYAIVSRPALAALPYSDLRQHCLTASIVLLGVFLWRIGTDLGPKTALAFAVPCLVLNAFAYWIVITKAVTWFLIIGAALFMTRRRTDAAPLLAFFVFGGLTAFFDFLTAPMAVFSTAALVHFLYAHRDGRADGLLPRACALLVFFFAGYAGLWATKIVIAEIALEADVWRDAAGAATIRLRGDSPRIDSFLPGAAIWSNLARLKSFWGPAALILFVVLPLASARSRASLLALPRSGRPLIFAAIAPLLWLELLSNHSQIHAHFTQMNFAPLFALLGIAAYGRRDLFAPAAASGGNGSPNEEAHAASGLPST